MNYHGSRKVSREFFNFFCQQEFDSSQARPSNKVLIWEIEMSIIVLFSCGGKARSNCLLIEYFSNVGKTVYFPRTTLSTKKDSFDLSTRSTFSRGQTLDQMVFLKFIILFESNLALIGND